MGSVTMNILRELIDHVRVHDAPVRDVWACAFWTAVTSRRTGLSSTWRTPDCEHGPEPFTVRNAGDLRSKSAGQLAEYALSERPVEASIGLAAINSLIDVDESACTEINAAQVLADRGRGKTIGVVGDFPFIPKLRESAREVLVVEMRERAGAFPATDASKVLPRCEVVCLTGTSFVNHTIENLLGLCRDAFVVICGPSTPLSPMLFDHGADMLCGSLVTDAEQVVRRIAEGACFQQLKGHGVKLVALARNGRV